MQQSGPTLTIATPAPQGVRIGVPLTPGEIMRIDYALRQADFDSVLEDDQDSEKLVKRFAEMVKLHDLIELG